MRKRKGLIEALIRFHWSNIKRDYLKLDAVEMDKRIAVISGLKAKVAARHQFTKTKV